MKELTVTPGGVANLCVVKVREIPPLRDLGIGNLRRAVAIVIVVATHHIPGCLQRAGLENILRKKIAHIIIIMQGLN